MSNRLIGLRPKIVERPRFGFSGNDSKIAELGEKLISKRKELTDLIKRLDQLKTEWKETNGQRLNFETELKKLDGSGDRVTINQKKLGIKDTLNAILAITDAIRDSDNVYRDLQKEIAELQASINQLRNAPRVY